MAKKKRQPQRRPRPDGQGSSGGGANVARRERKEEARAAREAERKRAARSRAIRRAMTFGAVGLLAFTVITFLGRAASPKPLPDAAKTAAAAAGCGDVERPATDGAPGGQHLQSGQSYSYTDVPATSGFHAPTPLPATPRVYTTPVDETQAVHTLEHGGVIVYYRLPAEGGPAQGVIDALGPVVEAQPASYLIPYPNLPDGQGMAFTAWNQRMFCPAAITAAQATAIARGFGDAFACTSNSPEGKLGDGC
jgi:uncharacterized protein DUF3105